MALMRGFSRVDEQGKIAIPSNIRREVKLEEGQLVEIKVQGPNNGPYLIINKRKAAR
ncbi:MAG: AbrB/MazE/SpoVT family DNA-binding domain-containing protein [Thermodesulfovibrionales bacterium]|nr:AbrB/MazE/SpoVT family DNA-binding domain-containing protein [Thermodesulfovibrionales bacterium]